MRTRIRAWYLHSLCSKHSHVACHVTQTKAAGSLSRDDFWPTKTNKFCLLSLCSPQCLKKPGSYFHTCFLTQDNSASYYSKAQTVPFAAFPFLLETTSIFLSSGNSGFLLFRDPWKMHLLIRVNCKPTIFAGIISRRDLFGDFRSSQCKSFETTPNQM